MMMNLAKGGGIPGMPGRRQAREGPAGTAEEGQGQAGVRQPGEACRAGAGAPRRRPPTRPPPNPFGLPQEQEEFDPADFNLPPEVAKFLNK